MVRLVDDLLDISRITGGKIELRMEPVDVAQIVAHAVETSRPLIDSRSQVLTVEMPEAPSGSRPTGPGSRRSSPTS